MDDQNKTPSTPATPPAGSPATPLQMESVTAAPSQTPPAAAPSDVAPSQAPAGQTLSTETAGDLDSTDDGNALGRVARGFRSVAAIIFSWIIFPIAIVLILHNFVFQAYHVLGTSMVPTLHESDYLIISKVGDTTAMIESLFGKNHDYIPARGQIVVFHYPKDPSKIFVKRVVGLPGDRIVIKNGTVTIINTANPNGFNPDTKYEGADTATLIDTDETVQAGSIFVLGDNRTPGGSYDSREWGELRSSYIIGNAVLRLLPLDQTKIL